MPFTVEPDTLAKSSPASPTSKKIYQSKLNSIEKAGLASNRAELKKNSKKVITYIEGLYPDDEAGRQKKRLIVFAVFWAMDVQYIKKKNMYWKYLQTINPLHTSTGASWLPLKEYRAQKEDD